MKYNILKKLGFLVLSFALVTTFASCERTESVPDASDIKIEDITGGWIVDVTRNGVSNGTIHISTYNTSANETTAMWLDDEEHSWGLKTKVNLNFDALTFSSTDSAELYYDVTVTVSDGIITKNGATAPSGATVDAISFSVVFSDIPNDVWEYTGYKATGMIGDN
ncbi:hypothetical protein PK35_16905 [Tamlana nanhaiensis]|uniref:Lipid-binding hydrolase n=1 Tax=Neotamlana nanhaiensis TaxID=1382798 RepID=A0A0D7VVV4_9FLAO|nr:lipid-binding protein [Tamlana nanhaiensis]KJD31005.1 hypothetical protein PK35_16905 [Tamlana nanhaiensis]